MYVHMCACTKSLPPFNLGLFAGLPIFFKAAFTPSLNKQGYKNKPSGTSISGFWKSTQTPGSDSLPSDLPIGSTHNGGMAGGPCASSHRPLGVLSAEWRWLMVQKQTAQSSKVSGQSQVGQLLMTSPRSSVPSLCSAPLTHFSWCLSLSLTQRVSLTHWSGESEDLGRCPRHCEGYRVLGIFKQGPTDASDMEAMSTGVSLRVSKPRLGDHLSELPVESSLQ